MATQYQASIVYTYTQAGKTQKSLELINQSVIPESNTLVIYITQSNNTSVVNQTLCRTKESSLVTEKILQNNIYRIPPSELPDDNHNYMIVNFWNKKNIDRIKEFIQDKDWMSILILVDEIDQGGSSGVFNRLVFLDQVDQMATDVLQFEVIFITATIANLSKSINKTALKSKIDSKKNGIVNAILNKNIIQNYYVKPGNAYIQASWFQEYGIWKEIEIDPSIKDDNDKAMNNNVILKALQDLDEPAKKLTLVSVTTRIQEQEIISKNLIHVGYNVILEMNSQYTKDYLVRILGDDKVEYEWKIPFKLLNKMIKDQKLKSFLCPLKYKIIDTGINSIDDVTLVHILQSCLFMGTDYTTEIRNNVNYKEFLKFHIIFNTILSHAKRPDQYPAKPKVAIVIGSIAGRGITLQNPNLDFVFRSYCFVHTKDTAQCGAQNTQKFGRALGYLKDFYIKNKIKPVLICTQEILKDALANAKTIGINANTYKDGETCILKDFVTSEKLNECYEEASKIVKSDKEAHSSKVDGVDLNKLRNWFKTKNTLTYNILKYLITVNQVKDEKLMNQIGYTEGYDKFVNNINTGRNIKCKYGKLWSYRLTIIKINPNIKKLIDSF